MEKEQTVGCVLLTYDMERTRMPIVVGWTEIDEQKMETNAWNEIVQDLERTIRSPMSMMIVQCHWDADRQRWMIDQSRSREKKHPNDLQTVRKTIQNIDEGLTLSFVLPFVEHQLKKHQQETGVKYTAHEWYIEYKI